MRNFIDKFVGKMKTYILCSKFLFFFRKLCLLWDGVEKYGRGREATDDNKAWHMHFACWTTKATNTHSEYVILIAIYSQNGCTNAHLCHVYTYIHTLPLLALASIIRAIFHDLLVLKTILIIRTSGRNLGTIKQNGALWRVLDRNPLPHCFFLL